MGVHGPFVNAELRASSRQFQKTSLFCLEPTEAQQIVTFFQFYHGSAQTTVTFI
jgi:hypothetical protein